MPHRILYKLIAASFLLAYAAPAGAQILSNGSFESGLDNWVATGVVGASGSEGTTDGHLAALFNSADQLPDGVLSQTIATVPGESYTVDYDWGGFSLAPQTQVILVEATGTVVLASTSTIVGTTIPATFVPDSLIFVADSSTTTLTFTDGSLNTVSVDGILDNIIVTGPAVAAVPTLDIWGLGSLSILIVPVGFENTERARAENRVVA